MTLTFKQQLSLAALRVSLGFLLVWWGLGRINTPSMGVAMQEKFYFNLFPSEALQYGFGIFEFSIGCLIVVGLYRKFAVPVQLAICGFSALTILPALADPFGLWLPIDKMSPIQHLFYPSVVTIAAGVMMFNFSSYDRFTLDRFLSARRRSSQSGMPAE